MFCSYHLLPQLGLDMRAHEIFVLNWPEDTDKSGLHEHSMFTLTLGRRIGVHNQTSNFLLLNKIYVVSTQKKRHRDDSFEHPKHICHNK